MFSLYDAERLRRSFLAVAPDVVFDIYRDSYSGRYDVQRRGFVPLPGWHSIAV